MGYHRVNRLKGAKILGLTAVCPIEHKGVYTRNSEVNFTSLLRVLISLEKYSIMKKTVEYYLSGG